MGTRLNCANQLHGCQTPHSLQTRSARCAASRYVYALQLEVKKEARDSRGKDAGVCGQDLVDGEAASAEADRRGLNRWFKAMCF